MTGATQLIDSAIHKCKRERQDGRESVRTHSALIIGCDSTQAFTSTASLTISFDPEVILELLGFLRVFRIFNFSQLIGFFDCLLQISEVFYPISIYKSRNVESPPL